MCPPGALNPADPVLRLLKRRRGVSLQEVLGLQVRAHHLGADDAGGRQQAVERKHSRILHGYALSRRFPHSEPSAAKLVNTDHTPTEGCDGSPGSENPKRGQEKHRTAEVGGEGA